MLAEKSMKVGHKMYQCVSIKAALARGHQQKCTLLVTVLKDAHHDGTCRLLPDTSEENFCKAYRPCQFLTSCLMTDLFFFFFETIIVRLGVQNPTWHFSDVHDIDA